LSRAAANFLRPMLRVRPAVNDSGVCHAASCRHLIAQHLGSRPAHTASEAPVDRETSGGSSVLDGFVPEGPPHCAGRFNGELQFEEVFPLGDTADEAALHGIPEIDFEEGIIREGRFESDIRRGKVRYRRGPRRARGGRMEKVAPPISDDNIAGTDPRLLARDQLIWCVGRAATLKIREEQLWQGFTEAIEAIGESQLSPSEVCRLVQGFSYAPWDAAVSEVQMRRLLKVFARNTKDYNDEKLVRMIYGYGKFVVKRGLPHQKFFDFVSSEVVERISQLRGWRMNRILQAVWNLPAASDEFRSLLVSQVFKYVANLDSAALCLYVPMVVELSVDKRAGVVHKLNTIYKRKLRGWRTPELLLKSGIALLLHDIMTTATIVAWLVQMHELQIPIRDAPAEKQFGGSGSSCVQSSGDLAFTRRVAENLEALKIVELCIRHERQSVHATLPPKALQLLTEVRETPLRPPEDHHMLELPFVFAELRRLFKRLRILLHPTLYGPYLLELADPFGQVVVEWDTNWAMYPPWRRKRHEEFVERKHLHLRAEGWRVLCVPLTEFQQLLDKEAKIEFLDRFVERHDLEYLRVEA